MRLASLLLAGCIVALCCFTSRNEALGGDIITVRKSDQRLSGRNFRLYPSFVTQTETFVSRHPTKPEILFASANTINLLSGFISEGIYVSTDAGTSWYGSDTCSGAPVTFHRGDPGITIDRNGNFLLIRLGFSPGLYSHFSTDMGRTWSGQKTIATNDQDRATLASDHDSSSSWYGRSYATWVRFEPPYPAMISYTNDGGSSWSTPAQINNPTQRGVGGESAVGRNGVLYVCWASVVNVSPFTEDSVGFSVSTDGGSTWRSQERAFDANGIAGVLPQKSNIRVNGLPRIAVDNSGGPRDGWIYIITTDRDLTPAGSDPDIVIHISTNGGDTWSTGRRVNQDEPGNGKNQFFPAIHVDSYGAVNVLYYDDRRTTSDSAGVFLSRSTNGGEEWKDYEISDHNFRPQPIGGLGQGYQGDNIGMTSVGRTLWPVWMDNSTGIYQIWSSPTDMGILDEVEQHTDVPTTARLQQNYPNPFNPFTSIEYELRRRTNVRLSLFDILGREVAILVSAVQQAGRYSIRVDGELLGRTSGIYLYRLTTNEGAVIRKMVYLK